MDFMNFYINIIINKFAKSVCRCVAMRSAVLRPTEPKLGTGVGFGELGGTRQLFVATRQVKGHPEVKSSRNALWRRDSRDSVWGSFILKMGRPNKNILILFDEVPLTHLQISSVS